MMTAFLVALLLTGADQDPLNAARDLYASAAYEDALAMLNRVPETDRPVEEARVVSEYRAFCLLALGRTAEAERAIETMVGHDPMYRPPSADLSPRVLAAFRDVRRRILPAIIQQTYSDAKTAFDRREFVVASAGFGRVLEFLSDPDAAPAVNQPPLSDLRTLAGGFRDLAASAAAPPLPVTPVAAAPVAPPPPPPPPFYTAADPNVVPPQIMRQELPPFPGQVLMWKSGVIEVTIDETGAVVTASMRESVSPAYDALAIRAAQRWRYVAATVDGKPVKFRKVVQVSVKPRT